MTSREFGCRLPPMAVLGIGQFLEIMEVTANGVLVDGGDLGPILLPNGEVPEGAGVGDEVEVFVSRDSEDRLLATTTFPVAQAGEFAVLRVAGLEKIGAFLDWGLKKDLFLPFREQNRELKVGDKVVVYIGIDSSDRMVASMKVSDFTEAEVPEMPADQAVKLLIFGKSDLGYKAVVDGKYEGLLFANEVHQPLQYGQSIEGFVKRVRQDGKIDLSLRPTGKGSNKVLVDETSAKILKYLEENQGFAALTDKTSPEEIYKLFGVSKKKYKIALGGLYKARRLLVEEGGVRLVPGAVPAGDAVAGDDEDDGE